MSSVPKLVAQGLSKTYAHTPVISDISLTLKEGEFASIIGPNASGKSTLLKILAGVVSPTSGTYVCEKPAYMPQDHALLPWRTVLENLYLPSDIARASRHAARTKVLHFLQEFGLAQYADFYPAALSGGTCQKIAVLRTALQEHGVLLLDEPFASLDSLTRTELHQWLQSLFQKQRMSVLLVTHDIREALYLSDTIYVLNGRPGRIREVLTIPFPHPRTHAHVLEKEACLLENKLTSLLSDSL